MGVSDRTVRRQIKMCNALGITEDIRESITSLHYKCNRDEKLSQKVIGIIIDYIKSHKCVRASPITKDVILINGFPVGKLIRECSIRELHNDVLSQKFLGMNDSKGENMLSYEKMWLIIKQKIPEMKKATERHKEMCGCEICIIIEAAQIALNRFRKNKLRQFDVELQNIKKAMSENNSNLRSSQTILVLKLSILFHLQLNKV